MGIAAVGLEHQSINIIPFFFQTHTHPHVIIYTMCFQLMQLLEPFVCLFSPTDAIRAVGELLYLTDEQRHQWIVYCTITPAAVRSSLDLTVSLSNRNKMYCVSHLISLTVYFVLG